MWKMQKADYLKSGRRTQGAIVGDQYKETTLVFSDFYSEFDRSMVA